MQDLWLLLVSPLIYGKKEIVAKICFDGKVRATSKVLSQQII